MSIISFCCCFCFFVLPAHFLESIWPAIWSNPSKCTRPSTVLRFSQKNMFNFLLFFFLTGPILHQQIMLYDQVKKESVYAAPNPTGGPDLLAFPYQENTKNDPFFRWATPSGLVESHTAVLQYFTFQLSSDESNFTKGKNISKYFRAYTSGFFGRDDIGAVSISSDHQ